MPRERCANGFPSALPKEETLPTRQDRPAKTEKGGAGSLRMLGETPVAGAALPQLCGLEASFLESPHHTVNIAQRQRRLSLLS